MINSDLNLAPVFANFSPHQEDTIVEAHASEVTLQWTYYIVRDNIFSMGTQTMRCECIAEALVLENTGLSHGPHPKLGTIDRESRKTLMTHAPDRVRATC